MPVTLELLDSYGFSDRIPTIEGFSTVELRGMMKLISLAYCGIEAIMRQGDSEVAKAELEMAERDLILLAGLLLDCKDIPESERVDLELIRSGDHPTSPHG